MKNTIPLVIAVVLGLAAVFAVSRTMAKKDDRRDKMVSVLVAKRELREEDRLREGDYTIREIPSSAFVAHQHVGEASLPMVRELALARNVPEGSFILWRDLINDTGLLSSEVGKGEWAVPVRFSDATLLEFLEAGDEIAIIMVGKTARDVSAPGGNVNEKVWMPYNKTSVLFPQVRITKKGRGVVVVSMKPREAMILLTANLNANLYPMLRFRKDDKSAIRQGDYEVASDLFEEQLMKLLAEPPK